MRETRCLVAAALAAGALCAAHADTRIVSQVTITGLPFTGTVVHYPEKITTFVRRGKTAVLVDGGTTTIFDDVAGTVTILDPVPPTFTIQTRDQFMAQGGPVGRMAENVKIGVKLDLKRRAETRTIAGQAARRYSVTGRLTLSPKRTGPQGGGGMGRRGGGGFPGGRRFPGGMFAQRGGGSGPMALPTVDITGEVWLAETPGVGWNAKDKDAPLPLVTTFLPPSPFSKPFAERLSKLHGLPLESDLALSVTGRPGAAPKVIHCTSEVTSIGDGAVEDSAFDVPAVYRKVDPQAAEPLFELP